MWRLVASAKHLVPWTRVSRPTLNYNRHRLNLTVPVPPLTGTNRFSNSFSGMPADDLVEFPQPSPDLRCRLYPVPEFFVLARVPINAASIGPLLLCLARGIPQSLG